MSAREAALRLHVLRSQAQLVLATANRAAAPSTHLMAYAHSDDLRHVFLASGRTRKLADMLENPAVSLLWDNRTGNLADHADGILVTARGRATELTGGDAARARAALLHRNPNMSGFLGGESVAMVDVEVETMAVVVGYGSPELFTPSL